MAANQHATVSVKILLDEEKNRVVCAEAGNDFVDILFGFLTLPIGTIVRLIHKQQQSQQAEIGCMNNLYQSVENLSTSKLWTDACKDMLLHPRNPYETLCMDLKVNVDDTKPTKYFTCPDLSCIRKKKNDLGYVDAGFLSNYESAICRCGKVMNREMFVSGSNAKATADIDGVFVKGSTNYIVGEDLKVMPSTPNALVELLGSLGIKDVSRLEERVLRVGSKEILNLLERSLLSESPLTDVFLPNQRSKTKRRVSLEPRCQDFLSQNIRKKDTEGSMALKIFIRKSDGKTLYAEAMEDFVDLLFSFLTIPLASVVKCLAGDSSLGCVDNLYKSVKGLDAKWVVTHPKPWDTHYRHPPNELLLAPGLAPNFSCSSQPFELEDRRQIYYYYWYKVTKMEDCSLSFCHPGDLDKSGEELVFLRLMNPKCPDPRQESQDEEKGFGEFVKRPTVFLVSDDLVVLPSSSTASCISYLKGLSVPFEDIEEQVIKISKQEALKLLKASLITTSALTNVRSLSSKKPKQEP